MRIKSISRFVISMIIIFIIIVSLISMIANKVFSATQEDYMSIKISTGDTLWSIAKKYDGNINENIYLLKQLNNLSTSAIYVGQELIVPVK